VSARESAAARKVRRLQRRVPLRVELQITSMMDMFTIILVFLLTFFDPDQADSSVLVLPAVAASGSEKPGIRIEIRKDAIAVDGVEVVTLDGSGGLQDSTERIGRVLLAVEQSLEGKEKDSGLVVAIDRAVPYAVVADVLASANAAGFNDYRFVVESTR
jgi:biopolymer transport protein ExbD